MSEVAERANSVEKYNQFGDVIELGAPLSDEELKILDMSLRALFGTPDSLEQLLLEQRKALTIIAIRATKNKLGGNVPFRGLNAGDTELGIGPIRPGHLETNGTKRTNWNQTFTAGWQYWLGGAGGGTAVFGLRNGLPEAGAVIFGLKYLAPVTPIAEIKYEVARAITNPFDMRSSGLKDNRNGVLIYPHHSILILPGIEYRVRVNNDQSVSLDTIVAPFGLTIAKGSFLKQETY